MKMNKPLWAPVAWFLALIVTTVVIVAEIILNLIVGMSKAIAISLLGGTKHYSKVFEYLYKKMRPATVCEICSKPGKLELSRCCNRWVHESCHKRETLTNIAEMVGGDELARMMNADMN